MLVWRRRPSERSYLSSCPKFLGSPASGHMSDFSVACALRAGNLLHPIAFGWPSPLQLLCIKLAFYRLAHLVAQFVCRRYGRQVPADDEQVARPFWHVVFLEGHAVRRSHANEVAQLEMPAPSSSWFWQVASLSY